MSEIPRYRRLQGEFRRLEAIKIDFANPGKFCLLGGRVFVWNEGEEKWAVPNPGQVHEVRNKILFQAPFQDKISK